jgi:hypothetical protein
MEREREREREAKTEGGRERKREMPCLSLRFAKINNGSPEWPPFSHP